jgi:hypothetical protein
MLEEEADRVRSFWRVLSRSCASDREEQELPFHFKPGEVWFQEKYSELLACVSWTLDNKDWCLTHSEEVTVEVHVFLAALMDIEKRQGHTEDYERFFSNRRPRCIFFPDKIGCYKKNTSPYQEHLWKQRN